MPLFRRPWLLALTAALLLVTASCGQKAGVALSAGPGEVSGGDPTLGVGAETVPAGDAAPTAGEPTPTTPAAGGLAPTAAPGPASAAPRAAGPTANQAGPAPAAATKQDRTGIDDAKKEIVIGIHAPVTGAAPIEQKTFENGREVYWQDRKSVV